MRSRLLFLSLALLLVAGLFGAPAGAATRDDADHSEHHFTSSDGINQLHADVLRPKGMPDTQKTPVVLTVSPYTNHNGSTRDTDLNGTGPSPRFYDFLDLTGLLAKGYTYVMVDLPGFGGSGGCNDWGGVREQAGVRDAVEWAASQPWSNGRVALLGKSYDGWTGLMGVATQPEGLAAVVAMEPVYSGYRYMYMNGVRRPNFAGTMAGFQVYDAKPGRPTDSPQYLAYGAPQAWCYGINMAGTIGDDSESGPYWAERNLLPTAAGKDTPVFLMQGFLETNTKPDGAFAYWNNLTGADNRAWFGQYDHVRGWDTTADGSRYHTGRSDFIDELMRFLDKHLKGIEPPVDDPTVAVQDIKGRWRAEESWPPADSVQHTTELNTGAYTDNASGTGLRPSDSQGVWTVSEPLDHDVWFSGEPVVTATVSAAPNANLAANVYEINEFGEALMISRGVSLLRGTGSRSVELTMYGQDWPIEAGHRIGVLISGANTDEFLHVATRQPVTVTEAAISLPFLTYDRTEFLPTAEDSTPRLDSYRGNLTVRSDELLESAERPFNLPGPLQSR